MARRIKQLALGDVIAAAGSKRRTAPPTPPVLQPVATSETGARAGTRLVGGHFPPEVSWQLRALAVERRSTVQALLGEALNSLFAAYGRPEIAPIGER